MRNSLPYQPILLRLIHAASALLAISAIASGFWVYNTYDRRLGSLPLPKLGDIQGIHGTIALSFLLVLPLIVLYSFYIGYRRLPQDLSQFHQIGKPLWWIALHRLANLTMLLAATFAVVTGRMMKEEWLPAGELGKPWYLAHLAVWVVMLISLALHLLLGAKVGGAPLLLSMLNWKTQRTDRPNAWLQGLKINHSAALRAAEIFIISGIAIAFLAPLFG
ncbi:cytochrome b/b6 domain-containing protein [Rivularia sp. UHCC 0363]|uniref:cytochrome b/b6 domain-containing protein n=1 Tax=Rivularia sp. UHCC 0363 TaxID=3110244 RepID=UPI002B2020FC|nr:cytochrome b/b6 domain-containing protein [Rivularia sp. UHCC 0363]MEA5599120.1 cytochrome b/b6 domain-containing protein [Rivularia sp. UHCC 0363]